MAYIVPAPLPAPVDIPAPQPRTVSLPPAPTPFPTITKKRINVRNKGQRGEREVIDILQTYVDDIRLRYRLQPVVLQRNTLQAHLGGTDIHGLPGFAFEVKFQENTQVSQWWLQTVRQAEKLNAIPILFYRAIRQPWIVKFRSFVNTPLDRDQIQMDLTCSLEDFLAWFQDAYDEACVSEMQILK
jgi:hypothetical protein